jgi:hypothetical protein
VHTQIYVSTPEEVLFFGTAAAAPLGPSSAALGGAAREHCAATEARGGAVEAFLVHTQANVSTQEEVLFFW